MKTKKKYFITLTIISIILLALFFVLKNTPNRDIWDLNAIKLKQKIFSMEQGVETINLTDLTPFDWDNVYSFYPYTSKEKIYKTLGYKWDDITEAMSEGIIQMVFVNQGKVVCYLTGLPSNIKYDIALNPSEYKDGVAVLSSKDDLNFRIKRSNGVTYLKHKR